MKCYCFLILFCVLFIPVHVHAQCTNPPAEMGVLIMNKAHKVMQYCNGDDWIGLWGGGGRSGSPPVCTGLGMALQWDGANWACVDVGSNTTPTIVTGIADHNTQIPLPAGHTEDDCHWSVSVHYTSTYSEPIGQSQEIYCFTSSEGGNSYSPAGRGRWVHCGKDYDNQRIVAAGKANYLMYCQK